MITYPLKWLFVVSFTVVILLFAPSVGHAQLPAELQRPFGDVLPTERIERLPTRFQNLQDIVRTIFNIVIGAAGAIFLVLLLIGGVQYMTAAGNEENTTKAKKLLIDAVIGLVLTLSAWAIGIFILRQFYGAPGLGGGGRPPAGPTIPTEQPQTRRGTIRYKTSADAADQTIPDATYLEFVNLCNNLIRVQASGNNCVNTDTGANASFIPR